MSAACQVRRATIEDLPALIALWQPMGLPVAGLDRRLTEFQVVVDDTGRVTGTVGFQIAGKDAQIHGEAFADFGLADTLRPLLWERLQAVAANHGIVRVWTRETALFWARLGLAAPDAEALAKQPPAWRELPGPWRVMKLREDVEESLAADKEFELFKQSERAQTEATLGAARMMNKAATALALLLAAAVVIGLIVFVFGRGHPDGMFGR